METIDRRKMEDIERQVTSLVNKLPPMPEHIDALLKAGVEDNPKARIKKLVETDPGICAELLKLANAGCFGNDRLIETTGEALDIVGPEPVIQMMGVAFAQDVINEHFSSMKYLNEYFEHSRQISRACRALAGVTGLDIHNTRMYSVAGLIHDIGRLVILLASSQTSARLLGTDWEQMTTITDSERDLAGMDHCRVGMRLCRKWNFTHILQQGVLRHHSPIDRTDISVPGSVIFIAHFLSASDFTGEILEQNMPRDILEHIGLTADKFNRAKQLANF